MVSSLGLVNEDGIDEDEEDDDGSCGGVLLSKDLMERYFDQVGTLYFSLSTIYSLCQ